MEEQQAIIETKEESGEEKIDSADPSRENEPVKAGDAGSGEESTVIAGEVETGTDTTESGRTMKPPLTADVIRQRIFQLRPEEWYPLHRKGEEVLILHDIDGNGYEDVIALYLHVEKEEFADVESVSDFARLYAPEEQPFDCMLKVYFQENLALREMYTVDLGKRVVLEEFREIGLSSNGETPFTVSVAFQSPEGTIQEWLFFTNGRPGRLTLRETFSTQPELDDIDEDGILDVLFFDKSFEEGMGYETYIYWYKWDGETYSEYAVTNVVRNIKKFLLISAEHMIDGDWKDFFIHGLSKDRIARYKKKELTSDKMVEKLFTLYSEEGGSEEQPILSDLHISDVVFPEIYENPFQKMSNGEFVFPLRVRIIAAEGEYVYATQILMLENPFQTRQFSFIMDDEYVHN
jgi:hypothetical protein